MTRIIVQAPGWPRTPLQRSFSLLLGWEPFVKVRPAANCNVYTLQRPTLLCIVIVFDVHKLCGQRGISQVLAQSMPGDKYQKHTTETVCAVTSCCFFKTRTPSPTCSNVTPPEPPSTWSAPAEMSRMLHCLILSWRFHHRYITDTYWYSLEHSWTTNRLN